MNDKPQRTGLRNAWEIPEFKKAKEILSMGRMNRIVHRLNALINLKSVAMDQCGNVLMSDANALLPVSGSGNGGTPAAVAAQVFSFRLKDVKDEYVVGHKITYSSGIVEDTGTNYHIAIPGKLRTNLSSEVKYGDTHSYSYAAGPDSWNQQRTDSWSGGSEDQLIAPPWVQDDEIWAIKAQTVLFDLSSAPIEWVMVGPWRQWAEIV